MEQVTCASCLWFGRDEEPIADQGWECPVYHCKAQDVYEQCEHPYGKAIIVKKVFVSSDRPKCKLYEAKEENAIS